MSDPRYSLMLGDCLARMKELPDASIDSCVTDPPYHLLSIVKRFGGESAAPNTYGTDGAFARASAGFMSQTWDGGDIAQNPEVWREVLRVLKPGAFLLAFSGTRTYHRMACAIEDAGFIIDEQIGWLYGSGMPKSHKAAVYIERTLGRMVVGADNSRTWVYRDDGSRLADRPPFRHPEAMRWWGWGTAVKPAWEPICVAQKPMVGTIGQQVLEHGVGVFNIDACRVGGSPSPSIRHRETARVTGKIGQNRGSDANAYGQFQAGDDRDEKVRLYTADRPEELLGRWPANVIHDGSPAAVAAFPMSNGAQGDVLGTEPSSVTDGIFGKFAGRVAQPARGDGGSAARFFQACPYDAEDLANGRRLLLLEARRFFYSGKADRRDRDEGCGHLPKKALNWSSGEQSPGTFQSEGTDKSARNHHPTVKPTSLMAWLERLVTPPGGVVLDPFMGSGSTGKACMLEGFRFIGIEMGEEYHRIATARLEHAAKRAVAEAAALSRPDRQLGMFDAPAPVVTPKVKAPAVHQLSMFDEPDA